VGWNFDVRPDDLDNLCCFRSGEVLVTARAAKPADIRIHSRARLNQLAEYGRRA